MTDRKMFIDLKKTQPQPYPSFSLKWKWIHTGPLHMNVSESQSFHCNVVPSAEYEAKSIFWS